MVVFFEFPRSFLALLMGLDSAEEPTVDAADASQARGKLIASIILVLVNAILIVANGEV